ncbi:MAG: hypothetical protein CSA50_02280 [Gammaproteobacteria bacterium]|nr:MAG: hypothetical protein CSA50_02280 [Gammaproteobacteria bacterium]
MTTQSLPARRSVSQLFLGWQWLLYSYLLFALPVEMLEASLVSLLLLIIALVQKPGLISAATRLQRQTWLLFLAFLLVGVVFSELPEKSLKGTYDCLRAALVFFVGFFFIAHIASAKTFMVKLRNFSFVVLLIVMIFYVLSVFTTGDVSLRENQWIYDRWRNLHEFANFVAIDVLVLGFMVRYRGIDRTLGFCLVMAVAILVLTTSRGNLLAVTLSLGLVFAFGHRYRMLLWWSVVLASLVFFVYAFFFHSGTCFGSFCPGYTYEARKDIYQQLLWQVEVQPWLGYGLNTFKYLSGILLEGKPIVMPNSVYLELLYSVGLIGGLFLMLFVAMMLRPAHSGSSPWRLFALTYMVYFLARGLVDFKLVSFEFLGGIFLALGLYTGAGYRDSARLSDVAINDPAR